MALLSYSQLGEWLACRYRWKLGYVNLLKRKVMRPSIVLGSIVHQGLEAGYLGEPIPEAIEEAINQQGLDLDEDEWNIIFEQAFMITRRGLSSFPMGEYGRWEIAKYNDKPAVELHLEVPLPGWDGFQAYIDVVLKDKVNGGLWVVDHKVRSQFTPETAEETNIQMAIYQYILGYHGISTIGGMTHQILNQPMAKPKLNKDGKMSKAMIKCDWPTYRSALIENGLDPDDYIDMAEKLKGEMTRITMTHRTDYEINSIWQNVVLPVSRDIRETHDQFGLSSFRNKLPGGTELPRVMNHMVCNGCLYRDLCLGDLRGADVEFITRTNFEPKQRRWKR